jgi:hypothetical protein
MERGKWCFLCSTFRITQTAKASNGSSAGLCLYVDLEQIIFSLNFMFYNDYFLSNDDC